MDTAFGPWAPLALGDVRHVFARAPFRWWVTGGHALELFAGRSWRSHDDIDVSVCRTDMPVLHALLDGWSQAVAAAGALSPWSGSVLAAERHENNVWCRRSVDSPWCLDVTVADGDADAWVFRRDPRLRVPWASAVLMSADETPYLAPELQLIFKSRDRRPKDDVDAAHVMPLLPDAGLEMLLRWLPVGHPWLAMLP